MLDDVTGSITFATVSPDSVNLLSSVKRREHRWWTCQFWCSLENASQAVSTSPTKMPSCDPHRVSDISIRDMPLTLAVLLLTRLALISRYHPCCWVYSTLLTLCLETLQTIGFPTGREFRNEYMRWSAQGEQFGGKIREGRLRCLDVCGRGKEGRGGSQMQRVGWGIGWDGGRLSALATPEERSQKEKKKTWRLWYPWRLPDFELCSDDPAFPSFFWGVINSQKGRIHV